MVLLIVGGVLTFICLSLIIDLLNISLNRSLQSPFFRRREKYPYGEVFFTLILVSATVFVFWMGLQQTAFYPYKRLGNDHVTVINDDPHLTAQVWLKKEKAEVQEELRILLKAKVVSGYAVGINQVEITSDDLGIFRVVQGHGANWGGSIGSLNGATGFSRDQMEIFFSPGEDISLPAKIEMKVEFVVAEGAGPGIFSNTTYISDLTIILHELDE
jgi:hypothetical protein